MKPDLLTILACPACRNNLSLHSEVASGDEISQGRLDCSRCGATYPISDGLPDLIRTDLHPDRSEIGHSKAGVGRANRDYHDRHAGTYEIDPHTNFMFRGACQKRIEEIVKWAASRTAARFSLDIGCGTGNVLKYEAANFKQAIGIDLSSRMIGNFGDTYLNSRRIKIGVPEIHFSLAAGSALPFADCTFSFASAFSVLHHIFEPTDILREAYRVLAPGGIFYSDWDFNRSFRTRAFFSLWLHNLNPFSTFKGLVQHFILKDEENRLFTMAEYHAFKDWFDAESLAESARKTGFSKVFLIYHWNHASIIGPDGTPTQPAPAPIIQITTFSRDPRVAFPIFVLVAIR